MGSMKSELEKIADVTPSADSLRRQFFYKAKTLAANCPSKKRAKGICGAEEYKYLTDPNLQDDPLPKGMGTVDNLTYRLKRLDMKIQHIRDGKNIDDFHFRVRRTPEQIAADEPSAEELSAALRDKLWSEVKIFAAKNAISKRQPTSEQSLTLKLLDAIIEKYPDLDIDVEA